MHGVHFLRVFTDSAGRHGDVASVVLDEGCHIPDGTRQDMTRKLNTGETAFINDIRSANISIMHPQGEIDFAGVAALAAARLLSMLRGAPVEHMRGRGGDIRTWQNGDITWARASLATMPPWNYQELADAAAVKQIKPEDMASTEHTMVWAWINEAKGLLRARTFAADWDIPEAEGNGSGALVLAAKLNRQIEIRHGEGSVIFAKPARNGYADIGGRVVTINN